MAFVELEITIPGRTQKRIWENKTNLKNWIRDEDPASDVFFEETKYPIVIARINPDLAERIQAGRVPKDIKISKVRMNVEQLD